MPRPLRPLSGLLPLACLLLLLPLPAAEPPAPPSEQAKPMPELADPRLNRILQRYYEEAFGGEESWERLVSLRIAGRIRTPQGEFKVRAYQKRPYFLKMTLAEASTDKDAPAVVLAYDGETAWKINPGTETPVPMEPAEARRFIHNARFDPYLIHPLAPGKSVAYLGLHEEDGARLHHLRVTLDTGYEVDYLLDLRTFLVRRVVNHDTRSGTVNAIDYFDYTRVLGAPIARRLVNSENGAFASEFRVDRIEPNLGVFEWMFEYPGDG